MATVSELFAMSNEALVEAWRTAKVAELEKQFTTIPEFDALKLEAQTIRLVISFRLMGREPNKPDA